MNRNTLLALLVLLSAVCAYASTVTIIYPTPVEGLAAHEDRTTEVHGTAAGVGLVGASGAQTLYNKTLDGATTVFNGSTTQNFSVATLTVGSIGGWTNVVASFSSSRQIGNNGVVLATFTDTVDPTNEFSGGVFTAASASTQLVTCVLFCVSSSSSGNRSLMIYKNGSPYGPATFDAPDSAGYSCSRISAMVSVSPGETIDVRFWQNSGAVATETAAFDYPAAGVGSFLSITRIH